ncbi:MAG TPA: alpha/beta hydrolase fold domain-containing protein [Sphingobium sp.]|nr:alpha/beta hydrolase fold domain-containing protein [Sphingobium sp.]
MDNSVESFVDPSSFPDQLPIGNPRAREAIAEAEAKALSTLKTIPAPTRVHYGPDGQQVMDIYRPTEATDSLRPLLIYMHGGGWTAGYPYWCASMAPAALSYGAVFISPGYGLAPRRKFPAHRDDVFEVLKWVHSHAAELGIDPDRIVLAGNSAGGHLAAMAAVRSDLFARFGLPERPFRKAFSVSGSMTAQDEEKAPGTVGERIYKYFLERAEDDVDASPVTHADARSLPTHLLYVDGDIDRIKRSNQQMHDKLLACGVETSLTELTGLDHYHTLTLLDDPDHSWWNDVADALGVPRRGGAGE